MTKQIQIIEERIQRNAKILKGLRESISQTKAYINRERETSHKRFKNKSQNSAA